MAEIASPVPTPKRKRDDLISELRLSTSPTPARTVFSFQSPCLFPTQRTTRPTEDGSSSPRSKVAQKFRDLALLDGRREADTADRSPDDGGGGAIGAEVDPRCVDPSKVSPQLSSFEFDASRDSGIDMQLDPDSDSIARKRIRTFSTGSAEPATSHQSEETTSLLPQPSVDATKQPPLSFVDCAITSPAKNTRLGYLQKSYPSINRLSDSKSRSRKRVGTPPPSSKRKNTGQSSGADREEEEPVIVDPVRAALTWREDEITIYDPDDKDDDGTGINGIGFRPTPAVAYQRAQRRRQQLAEYKKREESDARARRNQRRREQQAGAAEMTRKNSIARVHFSEPEPAAVITT
ncbi:hypothetical protein F5Y16DRAFT_9590 [Xylariaceae sp. FL0255]|nr:hypothetical protein F5Y16DRAFT_9590 [Xylariaceae sp. FL0255]